MIYFYLVLEVEGQIHEYEYDMKNKKGTFKCKELNLNGSLNNMTGTYEQFMIYYDFPAQNANFKSCGDFVYDDALAEKFVKNFVVIESKIDDEIGNNLIALIQKNIINYHS